MAFKFENGCNFDYLQNYDKDGESKFIQLRFHLLLNFDATLHNLADLFKFELITNN